MTGPFLPFPLTGGPRLLPCPPRGDRSCCITNFLTDDGSADSDDAKITCSSARQDGEKERAEGSTILYGECHKWVVQNAVPWHAAVCDVDCPHQVKNFYNVATTTMMLACYIGVIRRQSSMGLLHFSAVTKCFYVRLCSNYPNSFLLVTTQLKCVCETCAPKIKFLSEYSFGASEPRCPALLPPGPTDRQCHAGVPQSRLRARDLGGSFPKGPAGQRWLLGPVRV
jgi:hypothetical protein